MVQSSLYAVLGRCQGCRRRGLLEEGLKNHQKPPEGFKQSSGNLGRSLNGQGGFGGFPKLGVPLLGVPIIRIIVSWGLYWGPLILGNYHLGAHVLQQLYKAYESKHLFMTCSARCAA